MDTAFEAEVVKDSRRRRKVGVAPSFMVCAQYAVEPNTYNPYGNTGTKKHYLYCIASVRPEQTSLSNNFLSLSV